VESPASSEPASKPSTFRVLANSSSVSTPSRQPLGPAVLCVPATPRSLSSYHWPRAIGSVLGQRTSPSMTMANRKRWSIGAPASYFLIAMASAKTFCCAAENSEISGDFLRPERRKAFSR